MCILLMKNIIKKTYNKALSFAASLTYTNTMLPPELLNGQIIVEVQVDDRGVVVVVNPKGLKF